MLRAEILKLTTTTATRTAILIAVVGLVASQLVFTLLLPFLREDGAAGPEVTGDLPVVDLGLAGNQLAALDPFGASLGAGSIGVVVVAVVLLGVLAGTGDFRFGGITAAALAEPRRERIVLGKAAALTVVGATTGIVLAAVSAVTLLITLVAHGTPLTAAVPDVLGVLGRGVLAITLLTLVGLAVGLILRTQLTAVLAMLGVLVLEPVLLSIVQLATGSLPAWAQLMPATLSQAAVTSGGTLAPGVALGALTILVIVLLGCAAATLRRRDL
jgi:ABC-2 type transport system permease protein